MKERKPRKTRGDWDVVKILLIIMAIVFVLWLIVAGIRIYLMIACLL